MLYLNFVSHISISPQIVMAMVDPNKLRKSIIKSYMEKIVDVINNHVYIHFDPYNFPIVLSKRHIYTHIKEVGSKMIGNA